MYYVSDIFQNVALFTIRLKTYKNEKTQNLKVKIYLYIRLNLEGYYALLIKTFSRYQ